MKRAPAPTWPALRTLLSGLEVGERGELRVPDAALTGLPPEYEWLDNGENWIPVLRDDYKINGEPWVLDQPVTPPLRPGRYWVPEEWEIIDSGFSEPGRYWADIWYRHGASRRVHSETFTSSIQWYRRRSPHHMPRRFARLACSVGEERVERWCAECGDSGIAAGGLRHLTGAAAAEAVGNLPGATEEMNAPCPACGGTPPPTWVYPVKQTEVER